MSKGFSALSSSSEVIFPDWLRDEVKKEIAKTAKLYKARETKAE